jgi:hypothetical protein
MNLEKMTSGSRFLLGMGIGALAVGVFELLRKIVSAWEFAR